MTRPAQFLTPLDARELADGKRQLLAPLRFYSAHLARDIEVPAGFVTDYASVPRLPFAFWLFGDLAREAAVVHDYLYSGEAAVTRRQADEVFAEASKARGLAAWRRGLMWLGVRLFGGPHYTDTPRTTGAGT